MRGRSVHCGESVAVVPEECVPTLMGLGVGRTVGRVSSASALADIEAEQP
jgi:hypothetical protein